MLRCWSIQLPRLNGYSSVKKGLLIRFQVPLALSLSGISGPSSKQKKSSDCHLSHLPRLSQQSQLKFWLFDMIIFTLHAALGNERTQEGCFLSYFLEFYNCLLKNEKTSAVPSLLSFKLNFNGPLFFLYSSHYTAKTRLAIILTFWAIIL